MAGEDTRQKMAREHNLTLRNRAVMVLSGVEDVAGFDENTVIVTTDLGDLVIRGSGLHIDRIDPDSGLLELRGKIDELCYDEPVRQGSFWHRVFG